MCYRKPVSQWPWPPAHGAAEVLSSSECCLLPGELLGLPGPPSPTSRSFTAVLEEARAVCRYHAAGRADDSSGSLEPYCLRVYLSWSSRAFSIS